MPSPEGTTKRIALVIHALYGGGAERLMSQLASRWCETHEVHLITWSTVESDKYQVPQTVKRHALDLLRPSANALVGLWANLRRVRRLRTLLNSIAPDIVLSFSDQTNIVTLEASKGLRSGTESNVPVWIAEHSDPEQQRLSRMWERWRNRVYPLCSGCAVLTPAIAQYMERWISKDRLRVIPPAIESTYKHGELSWDERPKRFLFVGRLSQEKRVDLLLEAWRHVSPRLGDWSLDIVGDGPEKPRLSKTAESLERVNFYGWIREKEELDKLYCNSRFFVLTSRYEGFPVAMLEALSKGVLGISTDCSSALSLLNAEQPVIQISVDDSPRSIAAALESAATTSDGENKSKQAQEVAAQYDWSLVGQLWDSLLTER